MLYPLTQRSVHLNNLIRVCVGCLLMFTAGTCFGKMIYATCAIDCDPSDPDDPQVVYIQNINVGDMRPLDQLSIQDKRVENPPQGCIDQNGNPCASGHYYATWAHQNGKWTITGGGYAKYAFNQGGGSGGGGGGGFGGPITFVGSSVTFTCFLGSTPIDCDTGDPY